MFFAADLELLGDVFRRDAYVVAAKAVYFPDKRDFGAGVLATRFYVHS